MVKAISLISTRVEVPSPSEKERYCAAWQSYSGLRKHVHVMMPTIRVMDIG